MTGRCTSVARALLITSLAVVLSTSGAAAQSSGKRPPTYHPKQKASPSKAKPTVKPAPAAQPPPNVPAALMAPSGALPRGYQSRACGFDMDGDGVIGERNDDCNVCNGAATNSGQHQLYVDCTNGSDAKAGTATAPYKTISKAWSAAEPGTIVCFKSPGGACTDVDKLVMKPGAKGTYTVPARGNQVRAFEYPQTPFMLAGWDADADGDYPPHDPDDRAVISGAGKAMAFVNSDAASNWELAHFTVQDYGRDPGPGEMGFFASNGAGGWSHAYMHDIRFSGIDSKQDGNSASYVTLLRMLGSHDVDYLAMQNVECAPCGGAFGLVRGGQGDGTRGFSENWRFENVTYRWDSRAGTSPNDWDVWGALDNVELLDSVFDCEPDKNGLKECTGPNVHACDTNFDFVNVEFVDHSRGILGEVKDGNRGSATCAKLQRPIDNVRVDRCIFRVPNASLYKAAVHGIDIGSGAPTSLPQSWPYETIKNLTITDNWFVAGGKGFASAIRIDGSHDGACPGGNAGGVYRISGNTIVSPTIDRDGALVLMENERACGPSAFTFERNVLATYSTKKQLAIKPSATRLERWEARQNVYSPGAAVEWKGKVAGNIADWRPAGAAESGSKQCAAKWAETRAAKLPTVSAALAADDTCAAPVVRKH